MIRINLLENSKGKNKRAGGSSGPVMPAMDMGDMGSHKLKVLVVLLVAGVLNFGYWYRLDRQAKSIASQMQAAEQKNRELSDVKARYMERQTQANNYKRRVDVIDSLRAGQAGPVNLLAMLGETVNGTEAIWLSKMDDTGAAVNLEGTALSTNAVANLIANLQKTGFFSNVEIKETFQDDQIKDMQAFQFTLNKSQSDKNATAEKAVQEKVRENNELESYRPKLKDMERQLANLKQQLEIERRIVPDEKQVDTFMEMMSGEAQKAGVELRRYFAKPVVAKEDYTEVPF